ncbi:MAG: DUF4388 domain-containing protein, partial [Deltaproteobacteria bacterium]
MPPPRPEKRGTIPLSGDFDDVPFPRLLGHLFTIRFTGKIAITRGNIEKEIFLKEGSPVYATSNLSCESLGRHLVEQGIITQKTHWKAVQKMIATGRKLGDILIEEQELSPFELFQALRFQTQEKIENIFGWEMGAYDCTEMAVPTEKSIVTDIDVPALLFAGIGRFLKNSSLLDQFDDKEDVWLRRGSRWGRIPPQNFLPLKQRKFLDTLPPELPVGRFLESAGLGMGRPLARQLLFTLLCLDVLEIDDPAGLWLEVEAECTPVTDHPVTVGEVEALRRFQSMILSNYPRIMRASGIELFSLEGHYDEMGLKTAYYSFARKYHDAKVYEIAPPYLQRLADRIFEKVTEEYEFFHSLLEKRPDGRALAKDPRRSPKRKPEDQLEAELNFIRGVAFVKKREYEKAFEAFQAAIHAD